MANIVYRESATPIVPTATIVKNSGLTNLEVDANFKSLNDDVLRKAAIGANLDITSISGLTTALTVSQGGTGVKIISGLIKGVGTGALVTAIVRKDYAEPTINLATGIVKNTTGTGALTIAVASDFPILNQNTTGNSATATTVEYTGLTGIVPTWNQNTSGNALTVTNGVYTTGSQDIDGAKTFIAKMQINSNSVTPNYTNGQVEIGSLDGSDVSVGFHRGGYTACQLRHSGDGLILSGIDRTSAAQFTATGNVTAYSDDRLKTDWYPLGADFINKLSQVKRGTYTRKEGGLRQVGVSAQSLREVMPEAVIEGTDENKTLSVAYGNAALTACVQLASELVILRAEVEKLKASL